MLSSLYRILKNENGQAMSEYGVLMLVIVAIAFVIFVFNSDLSDSIKNLFVVDF